MSKAIETFFGAWGADESETAQAIANVLSDGATYADPRSQGTLSGADAISGYVALFGKSAPGWTAKVEKMDTIGDCVRVTVAFGGPGPDGSHVVQHGQYFVDMNGNAIQRMVGFVGTGGLD